MIYDLVKNQVYDLFQLIHPSEVILVALKVKASNSNMFGSASQNQFSSPRAILLKATIPNF